MLEAGGKREQGIYDVYDRLDAVRNADQELGNLVAQLSEWGLQLGVRTDILELIAFLSELGSQILQSIIFD